jgi:hypothetical protein
MMGDCVVLCNKIKLLVLFAFMALSYAQIPLNYSVENRGQDLSVTAGALKQNNYLPNPFEFTDGSYVTTFDDWSKRRNEIKADIEKYEIGAKPKPPTNLKATYSGGTLTVTVTENGKTVTLTSKFSIPSGTGPHPIVIGMNSGTGSLSTSLFSGVVQVPFNHDQVATYAMTGNKDLNAPFYKMYTNLSSAGDYTAWSWGVSRIIDGLALIADEYNLDMGRIATTGCSYAGKMALFSGAFDERVTLVIAQESGGGGINSWRASDAYAKRVEDVEKINNTNGSWFMKSMLSLNPYQLPHDHHELIAMIAPRAFLALGNPDYVWLGDESGYKSSMAAYEVWKAMGIEDRFGFDFAKGHSHCQASDSQNKAVTAFVDKFLRGKESTDTDIKRNPSNGNFKLDYESLIDWTTPKLESDPTIPKVTLTSPVSGATFEAPATVTITATATDSDGSVAKVEFFNGDKLLASITKAPYTYEWTNVALGSYSIKAVVTDNSGKSSSDGRTVVVSPPQTAYKGVVSKIPGKIEFENYDVCGNGCAYFDDSEGNDGGASFRTDEDVDIEDCTDDGAGYNLGWATAGEWVEYTVDVESPGIYDLVVRAASENANTLSMTVDGKEIVKPIAIPVTGGWQKWQDVKVAGVNLNAGRQVIRVTFGAKYVNLNYMEFKLNTISLAQKLETQMQMHFSNNRINLEGAPAGAKIRLFDLQGQFLGELGEHGGELPNLKSGKVLMTVVNKNGALLLTKVIPYQAN